MQGPLLNLAQIRGLHSNTEIPLLAGEVMPSRDGMYVILNVLREYFFP